FLVGMCDTFVDFLDNIISDNYKNALADLLEKEVEEEEDNGSGGMLLGVDLDEGDFFIKMVSSGLLKEIISKLDEIDKRAESVPLSTSDGTKGRRKNRIFQMHNGDRMLYEDREYYKDLFGPPERSSFTLDEDLRDDIIQTFSEEEVKAASCFLRVMGTTESLCPTKRGAKVNRLFQITFFWQGDGHKKKYRLARWDVICQPKELGGLGILNLEIQNKCLLSKWLNVAIIKDLFMSKGTFQVKDGSQT
ncbi:hypothetical protein ACJX0J_036321, partial [Zea mays]